MIITWDEPTNPNGDITSYEVTVHQTDNPSVIVYTNATLTVTSVTPSVRVLPFTNYTVTVAANTSAGQGEGDTTIIESPQAGMHCVIVIALMIICCTNFSFVSLGKKHIYMCVTMFHLQYQARLKTSLPLLFLLDQRLTPPLECTL